MGLIDFENNVPDKVKEWETIGEFFGIEVTEQDVWRIARQSATIPQFHNIYMHTLVQEIMLLSEVKYLLNDGVFKHFINSLDSHFYVNDKEIFKRDDFFGYLAHHLLSNVCIDDDFNIDKDFKFGNFITFEKGTPITNVWEYMEEHFDIKIGDYLDV